MARVLVVDDDPEMARMLCDGLADRGYEAVPETSGRRAIARLASETFDAVITDLRMPDADGLAVLAAAHPRPVLVMTAYGGVPVAGAYQCLTKPFHQDELARILARALGR